MNLLGTEDMVVMLQDLATKDIDVLIIDGDWMGHDVAIDEDAETGNMTILRQVTHKFFEDFVLPIFEGDQDGVEIIVSLGNNDYYFHNQYPSVWDGDEFWEFL